MNPNTIVVWKMGVLFMLEILRVKTFPIPLWALIPHYVIIVTTLTSKLRVSSELEHQFPIKRTCQVIALLLGWANSPFACRSAQCDKLTAPFWWDAIFKKLQENMYLNLNIYWFIQQHVDKKYLNAKMIFVSFIFRSGSQSLFFKWTPWVARIEARAYRRKKKWARACSKCF